jgi:hypothetical protein
VSGSYEYEWRRTKAVPRSLLDRLLRRPRRYVETVIRRQPTYVIQPGPEGLPEDVAAEVERLRSDPDALELARVTFDNDGLPHEPGDCATCDAVRVLDDGPE